MRAQIKAPEFSESVQSGTLLEWRKQVGDPVERDEVLLDLETDKVILEVTAPASGTLAAIHFENGAEVKSGDVLGEVETGAAAEVGGAAAQAATAPPARQRPPDDPAPAPAARAEPPPTAVPYEAGRADRRVPMSRLRQRIAERMVQAQHAAAILTTFNEVDMLPVQTLQPSVTRRSFGPVIVIHRGANRLDLYRGDKSWQTFTVATGQRIYPTPLGRFRIVAMWKNPWF